MPLLPSRHKNQPELIRSVSYPYNRHRQSVDGRLTPQRATSGGTRLVIGLILVVFLIGLGTWLPGRGQNSKEDPQVAGTHIVEPEPVKELDFTALVAAINEVVASTPSMDVGVSVVDIKAGTALNHGEQAPFEAASTAKLLTAIAYLSDVEHGKNTLDERVGNRTAKAALEALIVESDNEAWDAFNNHIMTHAELAAYADRIGFDGYDPDRNTVTPASLARLLTNLYERRLLNDEHTRLLLDFMARAEEVDYITSIIPDGTKIYHKPGYLVDRVHDATIIDNDKRPFVLVVFTKSKTNSYDTALGSTLFQKVTRSALSTFEL